MNATLKKWEDCYKDADIATATPASVLENNVHLLSHHGQALDLACGRAGNAQLLATKNFQVDAFDLSPNVINALKQYDQTSINPQVWNSEEDTLKISYYDVIVVSYFLQRDLFPTIIQALKPKGLLFYQTWSQESVDSSGPRNPNFRLRQGELLSHCNGMRIILYQEEGNTGDVNLGNRNEACLIAQKI